MARPAPGCDQDDVEAAAAGLKLRPDGKISRRGPGDAPALAGKQGFRRRGGVPPCLDLDEGQDAAAPGDDVGRARRGRPSAAATATGGVLDAHLGER